MRVVELPGLYTALGRALAEAGEGAPRIHQLLAESVRVRCVGCDIAVTPAELESLALAPEAGGGSPRLERLRLGYCARNGCDSRFYVVGADTGMVAWPGVLRRTRELLGTPVEAEPKADAGAPPAPPSFRQQWRRVQLAAVGGLVGLVLLVWWWRSGARVPGLSPSAREFTVVPSDGAGPSPSAPPSRPGQSNAPRSFQVR